MGQFTCPHVGIVSQAGTVDRLNLAANLVTLPRKPTHQHFRIKRTTEAHQATTTAASVTLTPMAVIVEVLYKDTRVQLANPTPCPLSDTNRPAEFNSVHVRNFRLDAGPPAEISSDLLVWPLLHCSGRCVDFKGICVIFFLNLNARFLRSRRATRFQSIAAEDLVEADDDGRHPSTLRLWRVNECRSIVQLGVNQRLLVVFCFLHPRDCSRAVPTDALYRDEGDSVGDNPLEQKERSRNWPRIR